ncbi:MAG: acireductone synthase [Sphingomonadales bacterium]|nr:MAG: acireductone synthase [Sphingomonadales bacterium]
MKRFAVRAVVIDIEGTTSSIAFVKDVLFPFARERLADFIARAPQKVAPILDEVRQLESDPTLTPDQIAGLLQRWIDQDRKIAPLKALQGMIWADGYTSGEIVGHIYADAAIALRAWHDSGLPIYIYSSGSIDAQRLIYGHTAEGDMTPLLSGYFDTRTGGKLEAASYTRIAEAIGYTPSDLLFLSDHAGEIAAAAAAGMQTQLVDRDAATPGAIDSFDKLVLEKLP